MKSRIVLAIQAVVLALLLGTVAVSAREDDTGRGSSSYQSQSQSQPSTAGKGEPMAPVGSGFTYQGQLKDGGSPADGQFDLRFSLYDANSGGTQIGTTLEVLNQMVSDGLFTVMLDFGASAFSGEARWLAIAVRQAGGGSYTTLSPRQPLSAVPYAMSLATGSSGAVISGTLPGPALIVTNTNTSGTGVQGMSTGNGTGVSGRSNGGGSGVSGVSSTGYGIHGLSNSSIGVGGFSGSGAGVYGQSGSSDGVHGYANGSGNGVYGQNTNGVGVRGESSSGNGVHGSSFNQHGGLFSTTSTSGYAALQGMAYGDPGYGIYGEGGSIGVWGSTGNGTGVRGATTGGYGVHGYSVSIGTGVRGESPGGDGVRGISANTYTSGVYGSNAGIGVFGQSTGTGSNNFGVHGVASGTSNARGVSGYSASNIGVFGRAEVQGGAGVYGSSSGTTSYGVYGIGSGNNAISVYGWGGFGVWAGYFSGDIRVEGTCYGGCLGASMIDHPLDPANKYLYHSAVQSQDMLNIYNGNVTTDASGEAIVTLPDWFEALNKDFRYQLTPIGQFADAIVASKVKDNRFTIKTDKPNVEVSWQVTGIRRDAYSAQHPIPVEEDKGKDRGKYLHPTEHGQPESKGIDYESRQYGLQQQAHPQPQEPKP